jgi:hypothetical protein
LSGIFRRSPPTTFRPKKWRQPAFDRIFQLDERRDGSFQMYAEVPSGRRIWVIWRYDREDEPIPDVFGDSGELPVFVITAY